MIQADEAALACLYSQRIYCLKRKKAENKKKKNPQTEKQSVLIKYSLFCQTLYPFENKHLGVVLLESSLGSEMHIHASGLQSTASHSSSRRLTPFPGKLLCPAPGQAPPKPAPALQPEMFGEEKENALTAVGFFLLSIMWWGGSWCWYPGALRGVGVPVRDRSGLFEVLLGGHRGTQGFSSLL